MEITEVRIKLLPESDRGDKLRGFCSITLDGEYVIRDLKIIDGGQGIFVAMPSRKLSDRCPNPRCRAKNHLRARYCNDCGRRLGEARLARDLEGRARLHVDIAHPINREARNKVHARVLEEYQRELERSRRSDYVFAREDEIDDSWGVEWSDEAGGGAPRAAERSEGAD